LNAAYFQAMAGWGANIVRVPVTPYSLNSRTMAQVLDILDQTITWAAENHIYVIIDFHSCGWLATNWYVPDSGNETNVAQWTDFWKEVSGRYRGNDVVAFYEIFNEPVQSDHWPYTRSDWTTWKSLADELVRNAIRPNDPEKTILVGGLQSAYDLEFAAQAPITDISHNIAYATHPYSGQFLEGASQATQAGWDKAFGDLSRKYPVFATEFGYDPHGEYVSDPLVDGIPYHKVIIDYLEAHRISWAVWCFDADWDTRLLKDNHTFEPSDSGAYFRSRLLELNGQP
jgi:endoglucanase